VSHRLGPNLYIKSSYLCAFKVMITAELPSERSLLRYWLLVPLAVVLLIVLAYPFGYSFFISFHNYELTSLDDIRFVGLSNYTELLHDDSYWNSISNTLIFVVGAVSIETFLGLGLALLIQKLGVFRNFILAVLLTPMFITPIAVGLMFRFLLNSQMGVIPLYLSALGIEVDWFSSELALLSIILIDVWQWTPFMLLLILAGLESLPNAPFEAAKVDGATAWFTFINVTLPLLRPVMVVAIIIRGVDASKVFEYVYAITRGGPGDRTEMILFHVYKEGFRFFRMGNAAAMSFILVTILLCAVFSIIYFLKFKRDY